MLRCVCIGLIPLLGCMDALAADPPRVACRAHGVRPLILLNANSSVPGPTNVSERALACEAKKGDRRVELTDVSDLQVGYSGLANAKSLEPEKFTITIRGIDGRRAKVTAYDPLADRDVPLDVTSAMADALGLELPAADYPYLLIIQEAEGGAAKP